MLILDSDSLQSDQDSLLIVVEEDLYPSILGTLERYSYDLEQRGISSELLIWGEDAQALRTQLKKYTGGGWWAFLVGDIPMVFYEQTVLDGYEFFPCDLFFSAPSAFWEDKDGDGRLDGHSMLTIEVPVSRIMGNSQEINDYFDKVHQFKNGTLEYLPQALIFKDDDWSDFEPNHRYGLESYHNSVINIHSIPDTTQINYDRQLTQPYNYIYQWIHSNPSAFFIRQGESYFRYSSERISQLNLKAGFYNLYDCSAARISQDNIAMTYLCGTDYGLATIGSTKVGGIFEPLEFHRSLSAGKSWGRAYMDWYNNRGVFDDAWYLGIIILGDPTLIPKASDQPIVGGSRASFTDIVPYSQKEKQEQFRMLWNENKNFVP